MCYGKYDNSVDLSLAHQIKWLLQTHFQMIIIIVSDVVLLCKKETWEIENKGP